MFKKKLILLLLFSFLLMQASCKSTITNEKKPFICDSSSYPLAGGLSDRQQGVGVNLLDVNGVIDNSLVFELAEKESLKKYVYIYHGFEETYTYKLLLFSDFKQTSFIINEEQVNEYTFKANYKEGIKIPIEISPLEEGLHDLFFVLVKYPDVKRLDFDFRAMTTMNHMIFIRFNIIVNNTNIPKIEYLNGLNEEEYNNKGPIYTTKNYNSEKVWISEVVEPDSEMSFYSSIGNNLNHDQVYALIYLLDYKQVPINISGQEVIFVKIGKGKKVSVPSSLKIPHSEGVYDLTPILILNPYEKLSLRNKQIYVSYRIGIDVKN